jgi:hypothetical protein
MKNSISTLFLILLALTLTNCGNNSSKNTNEILEHSIHNEDIYQVPIKTQVTLSVTINTKEITEQGVKDLLTFLYEKTKKRTGFKHHKNPTNIFIYAFTTKEKAESGMGQWIGMISQNQGETNPKIKISEVQFNSLNEVDEEKWGLSQYQRLEVWNKLIHLEDKARIETDAKYPLDKVGITETDFDKNADLNEKIKKKYKTELAKEYGIDYSIVDSVGVEGIKKGWAFPK